MQQSATELFCHILNGEYPLLLRIYESRVLFAQTKKVWLKTGLIRKSTFG